MFSLRRVASAVSNSANAYAASRRFLTAGLGSTRINCQSGLKEVYVGEQAGKGIVNYLNNNNLSRVLLICSKTLDTDTSEIASIEQRLSSHDVFYHKVTGVEQHNPSSDQVRSIELARELDVDCVCMVGGGSVTENGKIAALLKSEPVTPWTNLQLDNYVTQRTLPTGKTELQHKGTMIPALIYVPTTLSGTTQIAGYFSDRADSKMPLVHARMEPECRVLDPALTRHTPKWIWDSTALRCVDHCVETLTSRFTNTMWDGMAQSTLASILRALPRTRNTSDNSGDSGMSEIEREARLELLVSSLTALTPLTQGCRMGASHGVSYVLGGSFGVAHGHTSCVLSAAVLDWNLKYAKKNGDEHTLRKQEVIKRVFFNWIYQGLGDLDGRYDMFCDEFNQFVSAVGDTDVTAGQLVRQFVKQMGLPTTLQEVGIGEDKFDEFAEAIVNGKRHAHIDYYPVKVDRKEDVLELIEIASIGQEKYL